jgi:hypothetical protein
MEITSDSVREIFKGLENGDGAAFFEHVADNVDWIVEGTHPLAGHYFSKKGIHRGHLRQVEPGSPKRRAAPCGGFARKGQRGGSRTSLFSNGEERLALRQPLLLGSLFPRRSHCAGSCVPRLGDGRTVVRGESDRKIGCNGPISTASSRSDGIAGVRD